MYLVTVEDDEDGTWFPDPDAFDSLRDAKLAAYKMGKPPTGFSRVIYRCDQVAVLGENE